METISNNQPKEGKFKRTLGFWQIMVFGFAYIMPLAFISIFGVGMVKSEGNLGLAILFAGIAMLFTAFSYRQLVTAYPYAGSAYVYTSRSMNSYVGFISGWGILLDYMVMPIVNCVVVPTFMSALVPQVPYVMWCIIFVAGITIPNILGMKVHNYVNMLCFGLQMIIAIIGMVLMVKYVLGGGGAGTLFYEEALINLQSIKLDGISPVIATAAMIATLFIGFDAISTVAEETKDPVKTIRKAIVALVVMAIIFFVILNYVFVLVWPTIWMDVTDADTMAYDVCRTVGGPVLVALMGGIFNFGQFASNTSAMAAAARIMYAMGRDQILPKRPFGYLSQRGAPVYNVLIIAAVAFTGLLFDLQTVLSLMSFGTLFGFTMVNISCIAQFWVKEKKRQGGVNILRYLITPFVGACITGGLWLMLSTLAKIIGITWLAIGFIYLLVKTKRFKEAPPMIDFGAAEE